MPEAAPPAVMEMLLSTPPAATPSAPEPVTPPLPAHPTAVDAFADLERELRAFEHAGAAAAAVPDVTSATIVEELEAWIRVLHAERAAYHG
jgi:hypothetical protein